MERKNPPNVVYEARVKRVRLRAVHGDDCSSIERERLDHRKRWAGENCDNWRVAKRTTGSWIAERFGDPTELSYERTAE